MAGRAGLGKNRAGPTTTHLLVLTRKHPSPPPLPFPLYLPAPAANAATLTPIPPPAPTTPVAISGALQVGQICAL